MNNNNDIYSSFFAEMKWGLGLFDSSGMLQFINPLLQEYLQDSSLTLLMPILEKLLGKEGGHHVFACLRQGKTHHLMRSADGAIHRVILRHLDKRMALIVSPLEQEGERLVINEILAELVESSSEPVGIASDTHHVIYLNPSARRMAGLAEQTDLHTLTVAGLQPDGIGGMDTKEALLLASESGPINVISHIRNMSTNLAHTVEQTVMAHTQALLGHTYFSSISREVADTATGSANAHPSEQLLTLLGEQSRVIRENKDQLYYSQEIWRSLVEYNKSLVLVTDNEGIVHYCNRGFLENSTLPLIGLSLPDALTPPQLKEKMRSLANRVASGERMHDSIEAELILPNGSRYYCFWLASHLRRQDESQGITWVITDISREHAIRQRSDAMEKFATTGRMAARIAHEFNNPLAGIKGAIALVKMDTPADDDNYKYLCMIEKEIDRLSGIIRQMYGLYKPGTPSTTAVDFASLINECCFLMQPLGGERGVRVEVSAMSAVTAHLPEQYVREILYNLLRNAIEASYDNGVVYVHTELVDDCLHILIDDEGHGLPTHIDANIFEPFYTTKKTFQGAGLGLGLSVCRSLAETMGGSVQLKPRQPAGVSALVCLPLKPGSSEKTDCLNE
ncbi:MAG: PAS domain-containing sensor histidine kinase [bacterium]|nr:PAS domain-containing sensor histidine kinase [bacterium]